MSVSVAPPAEPSPGERAPVTTARKPRRGRLASAELLYGLALTLALSATSLFGKGGLALETVTKVEIVALAVSAVLAIGAVLASGTRRWWGSAVLVLFTGYAALCAGSILWSVDPNESWLETNRVIAWVALFGAGIALVRMAGRWWAATLGAIAAAAVIVSIWALLTKILPQTFSPDETFARLRQPYEYWNAIGLTAAMGIAASLWLGARRLGNGVVSALAFPAIGLMTAALLLAYSRGALLALIVGLAFWFAAVPLRLRSAAVVLVGGGGGALIGVWAFAQDTLTTDSVPAADRATSGLQLGALLLIVMLLQLLAGLAVRFRADGPPLSPARRRRIGTVLLIGLLLVPVGVTGKLALSEKGLNGSISSSWKSLTDPADSSTVKNDPSRLTKVASVRSKYWQEAYKIAEAHPWKGVGAGGYVVAREQVRTQNLTVRHAHGFVVQTAADLGVIGLAVIGLLTLAWFAAAARTLGLRRREWSDERIALAAMMTVVITFGVHSFVDWTWYIPGNVIVALLCAGWVAGRGPLSEPAADPGLLLARWRRGVREPLRLGAAALVAAIAVVAAWTTWQPLRADRATAQVQATATAEPLTNAAALKEARRAADINPLSVQPLYAEAYVHVLAGRQAEGRDALVAAVRLQPSNADTWLQLADYTVNQLNRPKVALRLLGPALYLNPNSRQGAEIYLKASRLATQQDQQAAERRKQQSKKRKK